MIQDWERNRLAWDGVSDSHQARHAVQHELHPEGWGVWSLPEQDLRLLGEVAGRDILEYGCGNARWSVALAKRGARVTALDNSVQQLRHAREAIEAAGVVVTLVHAPAESTPFSDASFDIVFCDHGGMTYAPPEITIPEVARILRSAGTFSFSVAHPLHAVCWNDELDAPTRALQRPYFGLDRKLVAQGAVVFPRPISAYVNLLTETGFTIELLLEPRPPCSATTTYPYFAPLEWARDFPAELMVRARKSRTVLEGFGPESME
jgi:SAM-dependent methyltransferase